MPQSPGTFMRDAASQRIVRQNNLRLTGAEIYAECERQAIRPKFNADNECLGYYDRYSGKLVSTSLPSNFTVEMFEAYEEARTKKPTKIATAPKPQNVDENLRQELAGGGRVNQIAKRLGLSEAHIRAFINAPESGYFVGDKGWIRPTGWVDPKGKK